MLGGEGRSLLNNYCVGAWGGFLMRPISGFSKIVMAVLSSMDTIRNYKGKQDHIVQQ